MILLIESKLVGGNAAIEAAKAGQASRGFGVVASGGEEFGQSI